MEFYTSEQVERLLDNILEKIPTNEHKFIGLRKYIEDKKLNIHNSI